MVRDAEGVQGFCGDGAISRYGKQRLADDPDVSGRPNRPAAVYRLGRPSDYVQPVQSKYCRLRGVELNAGSK